jgi:hypothetical protein
LVYLHKLKQDEVYNTANKESLTRGQSVLYYSALNWQKPLADWQVNCYWLIPVEKCENWRQQNDSLLQHLTMFPTQHLIRSRSLDQWQEQITPSKITKKLHIQIE